MTRNLKNDPTPAAEALAAALSRGIHFVALNDDAEEMRLQRIAEMCSVVTLSETFGVGVTTIAKRIHAVRKSLGY